MRNDFLFCDLLMLKRCRNAGVLTVYSSRCAEIERWSDQFKPKTASAATAVAALRTVHAARQYDKELLPPSAFEAIFEKKPRGKSTVKGQSSGLAVLFSLCAARRTSTRRALRRAAASRRGPDVPTIWFPVAADRKTLNAGGILEGDDVSLHSRALSSFARQLSLKSARSTSTATHELLTFSARLQDAEVDEEEEDEPEDAEGLEEDEEDEGDNDYEMDYFDNGEEDDFENLGGGGGGDDGELILASFFLSLLPLCEPGLLTLSHPATPDGGVMD